MTTEQILTKILDKLTPEQRMVREITKLRNKNNLTRKIRRPATSPRS